MSSSEQRMQFEVHPIERFNGKSAPIKRPREIAHFSYDDDHQYLRDDSSLKYYYPPTLPADLKEGFDTFRQRDETDDEHIDSLLETIMHQEQETGQSCRADFITWRGMMTKIMTAPFDRFNSFEMNAMLFQGTIFIEEDHESKLSDKQNQQRSSRQPPPGRASQEMMMYWGYKFETLSVIANTWDNVSRSDIEDRHKEQVSNLAQYCSIVRTGIGTNSLILGGEVDAIWDKRPEDPERPINWVELKTSETPRSDADMLKFERKLLKFWAQSFLLGVPRIIVGFRSSEGVLESLEELETQSIPGNVRRVGRHSWDGNTCINFAAAFLDFLKSTITGSGVWRISRKERSSVVEVHEIEEEGTGRILLPAFKTWREQLVARQVSEMLKAPLASSSLR